MAELKSIGPEAGELKRQLSWLDAAAIFVGIIIGSGIFVAPAEVAAATSSPWIASLLWLAGAAVALCGAFCYAECGARLPKTGGFYVFYREVYGPGTAFVAGFSALVVTYPASLAAIALIFAHYLGEILPGVLVTDLDTALAGALALVLAALFNIVGVKVGANVQRLLTTIKVLALLALCVAAVVAPAAAPAEVTGPALPLLPSGLLGLVGAMVILLWTYDGWSDVTLIGGELKDPSRDFGRAVGFGVLVLAVTYVGVQLATLSLLGPTAAGASKQVVADAVSAGLGIGMGRAVALLVVISTFGSLNGIVLAASRLAFAMSRDGAFVSWFGAVHQRFGTPARSTGALIAASLAYVFVSDFRDLMGFFSFNVWLFYGATAVALFILRQKKTGEPLSWQAPFGPLPPLVVILTALAMTGGLLWQSPERSLIGLAMLVAAAPVYVVWRHYRGTARGLS
ncbi:MAG: amino acid permease [Deltaproteobacteria bacterium]|nr:amino acid permease [Deltaproteobacteria bacterium]